jgi:hypothetical protein
MLKSRKINKSTRLIYNSTKKKSKNIMKHNSKYNLILNDKIKRKGKIGLVNSEIKKTII